MYYNIINLVLLNVERGDREQRNHCVKEEFDSGEMAGGGVLSLYLLLKYKQHIYNGPGTFVCLFLYTIDWWHAYIVLSYANEMLIKHSKDKRE